MMLSRYAKPIFCSGEGWSTTSLDPKSKIFRLHHFFLLSGGRNYNIEIQESPDGNYTAYADNTADPHDAIAPTHSKNLQDCLDSLVKTIEARNKKG
jgi:hypothetical protein